MYEPDQHGQNPEVQGRGHEVTPDGDARINSQAEQDRPFGSDLAGQPPEQERERDADELDGEDSTHQVRGTDADLFPVYRGHLDDRADAIVVEPEGQDEDRQLPVPAYFPHCVSQSLEAGGQ